MKEPDIRRIEERRQVLARMAEGNFPDEVEEYKEDRLGNQSWFIAIERKTT